MSDTLVAPAQPAAASEAARIADRFRRVREFSEQLCEPLEPEDCVIQSMPDVSPTRWHLAHTSWFFETFVLKEFYDGYRQSHPQFESLFNSYYNGVGQPFPRPRRGLLSRPTVREVFDYRRTIDEQVLEFLGQLSDGDLPRVCEIIEVGLHHEQQHQELMLTDIKHVFSCNPLSPAYIEASGKVSVDGTTASQWVEFPGGVYEIGHDGESFCFDNERPRHQALVHDFSLASRLTTNAEYLQFIEDGGYRRPELWLSAGWEIVVEQGWSAPLYWVQREGGRQEFTLSGLRPLQPAEPVCHLSFFEADAFARWSQARLPTEFEWEVAARQSQLEPENGHFAESARFHPAPPQAEAGRSLHQMFGDVWEWTGSPYVAYPGYRPLEGTLGEYNGKFMCNQYVLKGGSCATSQSHIRTTYRNFFPPDARWQFIGLRLAKDDHGR